MVIVGYRYCKRVFSDEVPLLALVIKKSIHGAMVAATSRHAGVSSEKEQYNYTIELMAMLGVFGAVINIIQMSNRDYQLTATSLANMPQLHWEICHTALFLSEKNCILLNGMLVLQLATASSLANRPQCDLWRDDCLGKLPVCVRRYQLGKQASAAVLSQRAIRV